MKVFQILLMTICISVLSIGSISATNLAEQGPEVLTSMQHENDKYNINTASIEELIQIPGIGPKTAGKIVEYRTLHGKFKELNELLEVKGIGQKKLDTMKDYITL